MPATEFTIAAADGLQLFARDWKPEQPARAVVVLIHGLGEHSGRYQHVAAVLNSNGIAVIAPDLRGHGRTAGSRGHIPSFETARQDIDAAIRSAALRYPGLPCFLYGHSMGALLGLSTLFHEKPPLKGAIISSPGLATAAPVPALKMAVGRIMYRLMPGFTLGNGLDLEGLSRDPSVIQRAKSDPYYHDRVSARLGLDIINEGKWVQGQTGPVPVPTLILQGSADRLIDAAATRNFAAHLEGPVTYQEYPGAYHELHNDPDKGQVFQMILNWLEARLA